MAEPPKQKCNAYQEDLLADKKLALGVGDLCPLCKKRHAEVEVGNHKSRDDPPGEHC